MPLREIGATDLVEVRVARHDIAPIQEHIVPMGLRQMEIAGPIEVVMAHEAHLAIALETEVHVAIKVEQHREVPIAVPAVAQEAAAVIEALEEAEATEALEAEAQEVSGVLVVEVHEARVALEVLEEDAPLPVDLQAEEVEEEDKFPRTLSTKNYSK